MTDPLAYPIGPWSAPGSLSPAELALVVDRIAALPDAFRAAAESLSAAELDAAYRAGGWSRRQVIHHVADSHLNAYVRFKLALSEPEPTIRPYDQEGWARLPDSERTPVGVSLDLLEALHARWVVLLRALSPRDWSRRFHHPETGIQRLDIVAHHYAWHGEHHLGHLTAGRGRQSPR